MKEKGKREFMAEGDDRGEGQRDWWVFAANGCSEVDKVESSYRAEEKCTKYLRWKRIVSIL